METLGPESSLVWGWRFGTAAVTGVCQAPQAHQRTTVRLNQLAHPALTQAGEGHTFHSIGDDADGAPHPLLQAWAILVAHSEVVVV